MPVHRADGSKNFTDACFRLSQQGFRCIRFPLQVVRAQRLDVISMRGHFLARRYRPDALHAGGGFAAGTDR